MACARWPWRRALALLGVFALAHGAACGTPTAVQLEITYDPTLDVEQLAILAGVAGEKNVPPQALKEPAAPHGRLPEFGTVGLIFDDSDAGKTIQIVVVALDKQGQMLPVSVAPLLVTLVSHTVVHRGISFGDNAPLQDGGLPDAASAADGPPIILPGNFGAPCTKDSDCSAIIRPTCLAEDGAGYPGGLCTQGCQSFGVDNSDCPGGFVCVTAGGVDYCMPACRTDDDCRPGYGCLGFEGGAPPACSAFCDKDADCVDTGTCNLYKGLCFGFQDPDALVNGAACEADEQCLGSCGGADVGNVCTSRCLLRDESCPPDGSICLKMPGTTGFGACQ